MKVDPKVLDDAAEHMREVCEHRTRWRIKIRLGMHDPDDLIGLMPLLNRYPLLSITIHPRTAGQQYAGAVDHD